MGGHNAGRFSAAEIDDFRYRLQDTTSLALFDPLGIDEEILRLKLEAAPEEAETITISTDDRWPIPDERRIVSSTALRAQHREPVEYPIVLPIDQVREVSEFVHREIPARDLRWVDDAEYLIAFRPFWGDKAHTGTQTEINRALSTGKTVIAYSPRDDQASSPFATLVPTIQDEQTFYNEIGLATA